MDALPVGVSFSDDLSCRNITGNPCLFAQFEISPHDNISASALDPAAPGRLVRFFQDGREIRDTELPLQGAVAENEVIASVELEVHLPSGRRWIAEASGAPILDDKGKVVGGVAVTVDITESKQAQEALQRAHDELELRVSKRTAELARASEAVVAERQRLYDILETMPILVCLLTPDYHVAFANRSFREKFGESNGRHCYDYCFGLKEPCPFCESYEVLKIGKPHYWEVTGPDGSIIAAYDFPFADIDGSPLIMEMDIDITEQRRAAEELRASEERYRQMFQNSRAVKLLADPQSAKIMDANQAASEFYGYELDRLKQLKITDINVLPPEETFKRMSQAYSEQQRYFQFQHRLASGELRVRGGVFDADGPVWEKIALFDSPRHHGPA